MVTEEARRQAAVAMMVILLKAATLLLFYKRIRDSHRDPYIDRAIFALPLTYREPPPPSCVQEDQNVVDLGEGESELPGASSQDVWAADATDSESSDTSMQHSHTIPTRKRKRGRMVEDGILAAIQSLSDAAKDIATSMTGTTHWKTLNASLRSIPRLTRRDVFDALTIFGKEANLVPLFLALNEEEREEWIMIKLAEHRRSLG